MRLKYLIFIQEKGLASEGADADLIVWDPEATKTISVNTHHQNVDFNSLGGDGSKRLPVITSQGKVVWENGQLNVERGAGRYIKRPAFTPVYDAIQKARVVSGRANCGR